MNELHSSTARRIAAIQAALYDKPMTAKEVSAAICLNLSGAERYMAYLMDETNKRIRIVDWRQCGPRTRAAVYAWGNGPDKPEPPRKSNIQAAREYRARRRKDDERNDFHLAKERAKDRVRRAVRRPTTWLTALGAV